MRRALPTLAIATLTACGGEPTPSTPTEPPSTPPPTVASVTLEGIPTSLHVSDSVTLSAVARDGSGTVLSGQTVTWTSSDTDVAVVSVSGVARARRRGTTMITTQVGAVTATKDLRVVQPVVAASIQGVPNRPRVGSTATLVAAAVDKYGAQVPGVVATWSSSNPDVAIVSQEGTLTGLAVGRTDLSLEVEGHTDVLPSMKIYQPMAGISLGAWTSLGPTRINGMTGYRESGKIQAVAFAPGDPKTLFAGGGLGSADQGPYTETGVFRSRDGGVTWTSSGTGLESLAVNEIFTHPVLDGAILVGTEGEGIYLSTDDGQTWSNVYEGGNWPASAASDFAVLGDEILAAAGLGILSSRDKGRTWTMAYSTAPHPVRVLEAEGDLAVAGTSFGRVLARRGLGGWQTLRDDPGRHVNSIALSRQDARVIHVAMETPAGSKVFGSSDSGASWTEENSCRTSQSLAYDALGTLWLGCGEGLMRRIGGSWSPVPGAFVVPGGSNWDIRQLHSSPGGDKLLLGTDQGLVAMDLSTGQFTPMTADLDVSILYSAAIAGSTLFATIQDFSPVTSLDGGATWDQQATRGLAALPAVGEGGTARINPENDQYCYAFTTSGYMVSSDQCRTFRWTGASGLGGGSYVQPGPRGIISFDPNDYSTVFAAASTGVYRSEDFGVTMTRMPWPFTNVTTVAVRPGNAKEVLVGGRFGLSRSTDGGATWASVPLPDADYPELVVFNPEDPELVLIGTNRGLQHGGGLLRSEDGGRTFQRDDSSLPAVGHQGGVVQNIAFGPSGALAVATSGGLWASEDQGETWFRVAPAGPPAWYSDVVWRDGYLYATTYGKGLVRAQAIIERR